MHNIWSRVDPIDALEELFQDFVDQTAFMQYFKGCWVPKLGNLKAVSRLIFSVMFIIFLIFLTILLLMLEMWLSTMKSLPLASQESCGATEGYHVKLKLKIYDDSHLDALQRVDWLVHKLTTELHSSYWLDLYADESGSFQTVKEEYILSTSWHRAGQIPDNVVSFDEKEHLFAKVISQKDDTQSHIVWNLGSEFAFCDCSWSLQGNLCKHVIKVNMLCQHENYPVSMSYQSFQQILMNLWKTPVDDSLMLDLSMSWATQIQDKIERLTELMTSNNIANVANSLPLKWVSRKGRTSVGKPAVGPLALPAVPKSVLAQRKKSSSKKKTRKRKRLSRITYY